MQKQIKRTILGLLLLTSIPFLQARTDHFVDPPDSAYLFAYSRDEGRSGLLLAYSIDQENWMGIGPHHRFLFSDFGRWGSQKRMFDPYLFRDEEGMWHCVWALNDDITQIAHSASANLIDWDPQVYPEVMYEAQIEKPEVSRSGSGYLITWERPGKGIFSISTADWKAFSPTNPFGSTGRLNDRIKAEIDNQVYEGNVNKVSWELIESLIRQQEWEVQHERERAESMADDPVRFARLEAVDMDISLRLDQEKEISDMLMGIFFEDISRAADGGLYAELIQNRDFEYDPGDRLGRDAEWNAWSAWSWEGDKYGFIIDSIEPIHENNLHYALLDGTPEGRGLVNEGWDGIAIEAGETYDFSLFAQSIEGGNREILVRLTSANGEEVYGEVRIRRIGSKWKKYEATLTASATTDQAQLEIIPQTGGKLALDMISLFPTRTYMGHENGLRPDLAEAIEGLNPKFVRFPGGCVAHGDGLHNIYRWKNSIGPLESRLPMRNIWNYHQTLGLGYFEYFQFCEDLGAEPVPVLAAGVPCQNSGDGGHGQCGGIPMDEMDGYVQDVLDLIEYANGPETSEWGAKRAAAGHPEPFNLTYLGIGNEDLITDIFEERFTMIYEAVREQYPEIVVIGTVGPFYRGSDYEYGWDLARKLEVPMVDEHYYQPPGWFINNQDYYDQYDRNGPKVYLGEYAAHVPRRRMNIETALSEALYLTAVERNADVVEMTSFAPLLAKEERTNWNPDLIYFNNTEVKPTVDYYVQQLFGQHAGDSYIPSRVVLSNNWGEVRERIGVSVVKDSETGDVIVKLVNLLPVQVRTHLDLSSLDMEAHMTTISYLTGQPQEENLKPERMSVQVGERFSLSLNPHSFYVFRVKTGE